MIKLRLCFLALLLALPGLAHAQTATRFAGGVCPPSAPTSGTVTSDNGVLFHPLTTAYTVGAVDCGALLSFTVSSAINVFLPGPASVVALPAPATTKFYVTIENVYPTQNSNGATSGSTAPITVCVATNLVTPACVTNSATINGATLYQLQPGASVVISTDGTNYRVSNGNGDRILLFASFTGDCSTQSGGGIANCYVPPPSLEWADVGCVGGGGGGGGGGAEIATGTMLGGGGGGAAQAHMIRLPGDAIRGLMAGTTTTTQYNWFTLGAGGTGGNGGVATAGPATGQSGGGGGVTAFGKNGWWMIACEPGGGGGGASATGGAGGGGGGYTAAGGNATAGSATGGSGGANGGAAGAAVSGTPPAPNFGCGGSGGAASSTPNANSQVGSQGFCTASGSSGGGIASNGNPSNGVAGQGPFSVSAPNGSRVVPGTGGTVDAALPGAGSNPNYLSIVGLGLLGGSSGGSGAGSITTNGQSAGTSGWGAGGSGGGGCFLAAGCTGGAGAAGGQGVLVIWEHNR
jgi:hypothetical protein